MDKKTFRQKAFKMYNMEQFKAFRIKAEQYSSLFFKNGEKAHFEKVQKYVDSARFDGAEEKELFLDDCPEGFNDVYKLVKVRKKT